MRPNQDVDAASQTAGNVPSISCWLRCRETTSMLIGQLAKRSRKDSKCWASRVVGTNGDRLLAALNCRKCRSHGDFGLAKAHVAADQPVHGAFFAHVVQSLFDGNALVGCHLETEFVGKGLVVVCISAQPMRLAGGASCIDIQQFGRNINDLFSRFFLGSVPLV